MTNLIEKIRDDFKDFKLNLGKDLDSTMTAFKQFVSN